MKTITISEVDKIIIEYYNKVSVKELCKKTDLNIANMKGRLSTLSKQNLIKTNNKKKVNSFTNSKGIKKAQARAIMIGAIKQSRLFGKVLTLPYKTCEIERNLIDKVSKRFKFIGCEREPKVFIDMLKTVIKYKLDMDCIHGEIGEQIANAKENEFDHLILDYCGQLSTTYNDIRTALKNKIVKIGGTIAITLNKRQSVKDGIENEMNMLNPLGIENGQVENAILTFIFGVTDFNYSLQTKFTYKDKKNSSMILIILKRVK